MRTAPGRRDHRRLILFSLTLLFGQVSCGGGDDGSRPLEPDPNAIKFTTLVPGGEFASSPSWSPDGNTVAFTKAIDAPSALGRRRTNNVFVISATGGSQTQLSSQTDGADAARPVWSPDGQNIVFSAHRSGDPTDYFGDRDLWIVPATGGASTEIETLPADNDPLHRDDHYDALVREWSPDGSLILFDSPRRPGQQWSEWRGFLVPVGGGYPQDLAAALSDKALLGGTWSPDGTRIACSGVTTGSDDSDIYLVSVAGGTPTPLVATEASEGSPDWSPDGSSITYSSLFNGESSVWVISAAGGTPTKLVDGRGVPVWSPDGRFIACESFTGGASSLWIVPAAGGTPTRLAQVDFQHAWYPSWSPDGRKLAFVTGSKGLVVASNLPDVGDAQ